MLPYARILVVDDSRVIRKIIRRMLEAGGFGSIDEVGNGGATHDVEKPFTAAELIERVRSVPVHAMAG